jgi:hypothetical protein
MARSWVTVTVAALFATVTVGTAGCAGESDAAVTPMVSVRHGQTPPAPRISTPAKRSKPVRLQIRAVGVDSALMDLGLRADGSMEVPPRAFPAGWYTGGPTPGELGPAVIGGHVDTRGPGVFYNLHKIRRGDFVTVTRADGSKPVFQVTKVARYPKPQFPTDLVYGDLDHPGLRLITCGGVFNQQSGHYADNLVVYADLVARPR